MFFHVPWLIATRLHQEQRYADAQRWFHFIFDPTTDSNEQSPERFWKVKPLQPSTQLGSAQEMLQLLSYAGTDEDTLRRKDEILAAFEERLQNDPETEFETALVQIELIALLRLKDRLPSLADVFSNIA